MTKSLLNIYMITDLLLSASITKSVSDIYQAEGNKNDASL
jgi:hypothetical protein